MLELENSLDEFSEHYSNLVIAPNALDVTHCFYDSATDKYLAPKSFKNLPKTRVKLYYFKGAPLTTKYACDSKGKLIYKNGKFIPRKVTFDFLVTCCLCTGPLKNVCLHEILDAIKTSNRSSVQGFRKIALNNMINEITKDDPTFNLSTDSAFIFSGENLEQKIELSKIWLEQITKLGNGALNEMNTREANLIKQLYDLNKPAKTYQYTFTDQITLPQTAEFLKAKFELAKK